MSMWSALTDGQGAVINGALTVFAGLAAAYIGGKIFGSHVSDLKTAMDSSAAAVDKHLDNVEKTIEAIDGRTRELDQAIAMLKEKVLQIQTAIPQGPTEIGASDADEAQLELNPPPESAGYPADDENPQYIFDEILSNWGRVRNYLEHLADQETDGRTRAKYFRVDRRNYTDLIRLLEDDRKISNSHPFYEAWNTFLKSRNRRRLPETKAIEQLAEFAAELPSIDPETLKLI